MKLAKQVKFGNVVPTPFAWLRSPFGAQSGGGTAPGAAILTWTSDSSTALPTWDIDWPDTGSGAWEVGDVVTMRRSDDDFATYDDATDTVTAIDPLNTLEFDFGGNWAAGAWKVKIFATRGALVGADSNTESITITSSARQFQIVGHYINANGSRQFMTPEGYIHEGVL
jgi:hypothetical protein